MNHLTHPSTSADIRIFSLGISKFCYIKKCRYKLYFSTEFLFILNFLESFKICLMNLVIILIMSAKMATPGLLKITVSWNKGYDVSFLSMTSPTKIYHVIQIILPMCSCDQSLITVAFLWEKLSQPQFYKDFTKKTAFFEEWSFFKFNNVGLALGTNLKSYTNVPKGLKLKPRMVWGLTPTFVEVTAEKLVGGGFFAPSLHPLPHPE